MWGLGFVHGPKNLQAIVEKAMMSNTLGIQVALDASLHRLPYGLLQKHIPCAMVAISRRVFHYGAW